MWLDKKIGKELGLDDVVDVKDATSVGNQVQDSMETSDPSTEASDRMARLHRAEWADYVKRFQPYDQLQVKLASGTEDNEAAIARARNSVDTGFDVAEKDRQISMSRYGLSDLPDARASRQRQNSAARAAAEVSAVNGARIHTQDRDMAMVSGDLASGLRSGRLGGNN